MPLANTIADIWNRFQGELFPTLAEDLGPLTAIHQRFVAVLDLKPVETFIQTAFVRSWSPSCGPPP